ncbi:MAG: hypothetical protein CTY15_11420 [Methylocystis sp.]|nr:MAG: hypothetical protein CTY15_11420 [Methylocystis sp.]
MRILATALAAVLAFATAAHAGDPAGKYSVVGKNPGGQGSYSGTAVVEKTGETYKVTWNIGGSIYVGTGIGDPKFLAVSYRAGDNSGLALYGEEGENWAGIWTYQNGKKVGAEKWTRQ